MYGMLILPRRVTNRYGCVASCSKLSGTQLSLLATHIEIENCLQLEMLGHIEGDLFMRVKGNTQQG